MQYHKEAHRRSRPTYAAEHASSRMYAISLTHSPNAQHSVTTA